MNCDEGVAAKLHLRSPPLPTEENYSHPQGSCVPIVSNLIDSDSFDVNESGRSIVAGILLDLKNSWKLPLCQEIACSIDHRKLDHRHPLGLICLLRGELHRSLFKHLSRVQELVFERDVETRTFTLFKLL